MPFPPFSATTPQFMSKIPHSVKRVRTKRVSRSNKHERRVFYRVPHHVKKSDRPTVSKIRAKAPTATVSRGLFSVMICAMNYFRGKRV